MFRNSPQLPQIRGSASEDIPNWRALKPGEMSEYTLRPGNPTMPNWNCKHCWRSNTLNPYDSKDKQLGPIINHVKTKFVLTSPLLATFVRLTSVPTHAGMRSIGQVTRIITSTGRMGYLSSFTWMRTIHNKVYVLSYLPYLYVNPCLSTPPDCEIQCVCYSN